MKYLLLILLLKLASVNAVAQNKTILADTIALEGVTVLSRSQKELFSRDSIELFQELERMCAIDQKFRKGKKGYYMEHVAEQNAIDGANVPRLMQVTEMYGFPSLSRFASAKTIIHPHIIFVHAPRQYWDTLKPLVEKEFKNGSINQAAYAHIMWHLNGRKGTPEIEGAKVKHKKNGKVVQKMRKSNTF